MHTLVFLNVPKYPRFSSETPNSRKEDVRRSLYPNQNEKIHKQSKNIMKITYGVGVEENASRVDERTRVFQKKTRREHRRGRLMNYNQNQRRQNDHVFGKHVTEFDRRATNRGAPTTSTIA